MGLVASSGQLRAGVKLRRRPPGQAPRGSPGSPEEELISSLGGQINIHGFIFSLVWLEGIDQWLEYQ